MDRPTLFDAHFHVIDDKFPLVPNHGFLPDRFTVGQYLQRMKAYELCGGAVVSGSFQAFDQTYLIDALTRLGPSFVGVTQLAVDVTDDEILRLDKYGVRGLRFNLRRGGSEGIAQLHRMACRVHELAGWHVELYVDSVDLSELYGILKKLPALCIDHLGLSSSGKPTILRLMEQGVMVKASGFGRVEFAVATALREFIHANPEALMFGTDLPSTRAPRPYTDNDCELVMDTLGEEKAAQVLYRNAVKFYKIETKPRSDNSL